MFRRRQPSKAGIIGLFALSRVHEKKGAKQERTKVVMLKKGWSLHTRLVQ